MRHDLALLKFANLRDVAHLTAPGTYDKQEELVAYCREQNVPFMAIMPLRHRFKCSRCGIEQGESIYHFENPATQSGQDSSKIMWGPAKGLFAQLQTERLHHAFAHGKDFPAQLLAVLESVSR